MAQRSFSFLLARRYLNPRRAVMSSFTLISLIGVLLGVLVLVVVMSVMAGMERSVKERVLGFSPHILMSYHPDGGQSEPLEGWREPAKKFASVPGVKSATPFVAESVILDFEDGMKPTMSLFYGIDTSDPIQVETIGKMLDVDRFPGSSADMGLDDRVVISSALAELYHLEVGSTMLLYPTKNLGEMMTAYKSTDNPPVREAFKDPWTKANELLAKGWKQEGAKEVLSLSTIQESGECFSSILGQRIRQQERDLIEAILKNLESGQVDEAAGVSRFEPNARKGIDGWLVELSKTDAETMNNEIMKNLKSVVLPKEATVIGVYQSSQMLNTPDIFMPMGLAQTLAGLDDKVQAIALRLDDPYQADQVAQAVLEAGGPDWAKMTWMEQEQIARFFNLISQQRVMMYFALSFIVLVSAFSMMAVMFTVTIQKKREIGVMKALGAAPGQIVRVFLYQGMILGLLGAVLGVGLGRLVIHYRGGVQAVLRGLGFDPFSATFTGFSVLPAHNNPVEQALIAFFAFVLCSLAALVPAAFAARSDAAKSLRNL